MIPFLIWIIGLLLVPKLLKPFEAGYGVVTIGGLFIWTVFVMLFTWIFRHVHLVAYMHIM